MILKKSPAAFGSYKILLVYTCIFEMLYASLLAYLVPVHYSFGTTDIALVLLSDKSLSPILVRFLIAVFYGFFGATQSVYAVHFIYRYLVVNKHSLMKSFDSWKIVIWLLVPVIVFASWVLTGMLLCGSDKEIIELSREEVLKAFGTPIEHFEFLGGTMYDIIKDGTITPHYKFLGAAAFMSVTVNASFFTAIIIFCAIKCYSYINEIIETSSTTSSKTCAIQKQLFYALVCTILIPTLVLDVPVTSLLILNLANTGIGAKSAYLSFIMTFYPVIDTLPNFLIIEPYRKAVLGSSPERLMSYSRLL
ncbi:unnamed protein product [Caenorhabditis nigoni]